ncbi:MAG: hypothetical protein ABIJ73_04975, partial [Pseudomonadota bacterium]
DGQDEQRAFHEHVSDGRSFRHFNADSFLRSHASFPDARQAEPMSHSMRPLSGDVNPAWWDKFFPA